MGAKLNEIMKRVNKDTKDEVFTVGLPEYNYEKVPFTSPRMNYVTYGGLPLGRLIEFFGEEGGGKTTTSLDIVANFQRAYPDKDVLYIDAENTLDADWARKIGVDVDRMIIYKPQTESAEYILNVIKEATLSGEVGLWVLDSVPCLTSEKDLGKELTDDARVGGISGVLTRFCREINGPCAKMNCMGIFINQIRDKIGSTIPGQISTPGGRALKHYCTTRIQFMKGSYLDDKGKTLSRRSGTPDSQQILVNMVKTKFCDPKRHVGHYTINYDIGIDYLADLIDLAIMYDVVNKSGAWFSIVDPDTGEIKADKLQGQAKVCTLLEENQDLLDWIDEVVNNKMQES